MGEAIRAIQSRLNDTALAPGRSEHAGSPRLFERVAHLLRRVDYRRAATDAEKDAIFRLRYESYIREGGTPPNSHRRLADMSDEFDNAWSFGVFIEDKLVSSLRIHVLNKEHRIAHSTRAFSDVLSPEIEAGKTIVDPSRFVSDYASARLFPELPYVTLRLFFLAAEYFDCDLVTATVRSEHQAFYKRALGLFPVCSPRQFPTMTQPITLMFLDFPARRDWILERHPYFRSLHQERSQLFERPDMQDGLPRHLHLPFGPAGPERPVQLSA